MSDTSGNISRNELYDVISGKNAQLAEKDAQIAKLQAALDKAKVCGSCTFWSPLGRCKKGTIGLRRETCDKWEAL